MQATFLLFIAALCLCNAQNDPASKDTVWIPLTNQNFATGTLRIQAPGYYRLEEDILFNPKAPSDEVDAWSAYQLDASEYKSGGGVYDDLAYQIGYWAAITIETSQVTIDLNGHSIGQHPAHNLMNRYFNVIELATQPFISGQGFHNFGPTGPLAVDTLFSASFVTIYNGRIGRASTNGIHGTGNKNIHIHHIAFENFEVSAVSLYGAENVLVDSCSALGSRTVPVTTLWETALHLRPFLDFMTRTVPDFTLTVQGEPLSVSTITSTLRELVNVVYDVIINQQSDLRKIGPDTSPIQILGATLFANDNQRPDGNCFAFSVVSRNLDIDGFPFGYREVDTPSLNVNFTNCIVHRLDCAPAEVVALTASVENTNLGTVVTPVLDPRGHIFSVLQMDFDFSKHNLAGFANVSYSTMSVPNGDLTQGEYLGNPIANGQAILGKAILLGFMNESRSGMNVRKSSFNKDLIAWIEAPSGSPEAAIGHYQGSDDSPTYRGWICNGDEIYRVQMGVAGYRMASTWNSAIIKSVAYNINNWGYPGTSVCAKFTNSTRSHPGAVFTGYGGADARGFVFASVRNVISSHNLVRWSESRYGSTIGFDVLTDSQGVLLDRSEIRKGAAGLWVGGHDEFTINAIHEGFYTGSTRWPSAIGIHTDQRSHGVILTPYCVNELSAPDSFMDFKTVLGPNTTDSFEWGDCHAGDEAWWIWFLLAFVCLIFIIALIALIFACTSGGDSNASYQEMR